MSLSKGSTLAVLLIVGLLLQTTCLLASRPTSPEKANCTQLSQLSEGPYWVEEDLLTSDVRANLSYGVPLNITFKTVDGAERTSPSSPCVPIEKVRIDLWQCRYDGVYSDEEEESTEGETWLRGYQYTNSTGYATFYTIYPGWYTSRTVHIHVRLRMYEEDGNSTSYEDTTQLYFDDSISEAIYKNVYPYNSRGLAVRDTFNNNDPLFTSSNVITLVGSYNDTNGYSSSVEFTLPLSGGSQSIAVAHGVDNISGGYRAVASN